MEGLRWLIIEQGMQPVSLPRDAAICVDGEIYDVVDVLEAMANMLKRIGEDS